MASSRAALEPHARWITAVGFAWIASGLAVAAWASPESHAEAKAAKPGCEIKDIDPTKFSQPFKNPPEAVDRDARPDVVDIDLDVKYAGNEIAGCKTRLRSYNGGLVGPTVRVRPGWTFRATIDNQLPEISDAHQHFDEEDKQRLLATMPNEASREELRQKFTDLEFIKELRREFEGHGGRSTPAGYRYDPPTGDAELALAAHDHNDPFDFNVTNLHTHGWHVSPVGRSDNVFVDIEPDEIYRMRVQLPGNHVAGTAWYHAHKHGNTALQVSSGMAGTLITEGGIRDLPQIKNAEEKILVFQQVAYDEQGEIEGEESYTEQLTGAKFQQLGRPTLINGQVAPIIQVRPGEVQYWRTVHAGISRPLNLQIQKANTHNQKGGEVAMPFWEVALDGIPTGALLDLNSLDLRPGYRVDALVQIPRDARKGTKYYLMSAGTRNIEAGSGDRIRGGGHNILLAVLEVVNGRPAATELPRPEDLAAVLAKHHELRPVTEEEIAQGNRKVQQVGYALRRPANVASYWCAGTGEERSCTTCPSKEKSKDGKTCEPCGNESCSPNYYCPYPDKPGVSCRECTKVRPCIASYWCPDDGGYCLQCPPEQKSDDGRTCRPCNADKEDCQETQYMLTMSLYDQRFFIFSPEETYVRTLYLDTADEWQIQTTGSGAHPFHIHVNPFQYERTVETASSKKDTRWVWKDTLVAPSTPLTLRTRYTQFTGAFVQHCHILNHEDQGMMQVVEIVKKPGS